MKQCLVLLACFICIHACSQTQNEPRVTRLDYQKRPVSPNGAFSYLENLWQEGEVFRAQLFSYPERTLMADYYYQHNDRKTLQGRYLTYHNNGRIKDSMHYVMGTRQGSHIAWNDKGSKTLQFQYFNDKPVDSCFAWDDEGRLARLLVTDSLGNGVEQVRYNNGNLKETGSLDSGRRSGLWRVMTEDGQPMMELNYIADSLTQTRCIDAEGKTLAGNCIYESQPEFPGGRFGWRTFLEKNLVYPREVIKLDIEGVVKVQFVVDKDGSISDLKIISSPHPSLSEEVLRLMNKSPKWIPAIQLNKPVKSGYIQSVVFRLS